MFHRATLILTMSIILGLVWREFDSVRNRTWAEKPVNLHTFALSEPRQLVRPEKHHPVRHQEPVVKADLASGLPGGGAQQRLREGREVRDPAAIFQSTGDRLSCWLPTLKVTVTVLENLTLERVHELLTRHEEAATWEVEGVITEHQGRNYMLLRRAVINSVLMDE